MDNATLLLQIFTPAAVVGGLALWRTHRSDRRDLFLQLHDQLTSPEVQQGRRLIHEFARNGTGWSDTATDAAAEARDKANRALAMFDVVGWYVRKKYVDPSDVLALWAPAIVLCWHRAYEPYIERRRHTEGWDIWPHFEALVEEAEIYLRRTHASGVLDRITTHDGG